MKTQDNLLQIRSIITRKVDDEVAYLVGIGSEITDELNGEIEKRIRKLSPNSETNKKELEALSSSIDLKFSDMNQSLNFSIGNIEKNVLEQLKLLKSKDPSYEDNKVMGIFEDSLWREETKWIDTFTQCHKSYMEKMNQILNKSKTFDKLNQFLKKSNTLFEKRNSEKRGFELRR